jgi:hypothetical protein
MANLTQRQPRLVASENRPEAEASARHRSQVNQSDLAYERLEDMVVNCQLKPGRFLAMQDLQELAGLGRTPALLAAIYSSPGDQPIGRQYPGHRPSAPWRANRPERSRTRGGLLPLRRDTERFVIGSGYR